MLEERLVELQAQLAAAQQTAGKADAGSKQLLQDKEQQVSHSPWGMPAGSPCCGACSYHASNTVASKP